MLRIGSSCRIGGLRPEAVLAIALIAPLFDGLDAVLTHAIDGRHRRASLHYTGNAFDIDLTGDVSGDVGTSLVMKIVKVLDQDFDVIWENDHWHIEYQPKQGMNI